MKNLILVLMLLISACGKENSVIPHYCLNGMYKQDGADVYYMFKPNGQVGFDTVSLDGCFYIGTYNCDGGTLSVNLTTPSAPECGTGSATFNYSTTMTTLSLEINGSTTTWSL